jgi:hypothetical protein
MTVAFQNCEINTETPTSARATHSKFAWIAFGVIAYIFMIFRMAACGDLRDPMTSRDSFAYLSIAKQSIFSGGFYTGEKPFILPLLYKLAGAHFATAVMLQAFIGIAARTFLAYSLFRILRTSAAGLIVSVLILSFGCTRQVANWDNVALSESVTLSLLLSCLAVVVPCLFVAACKPYPPTRLQAG